MSFCLAEKHEPKVTVERLQEFKGNDLNDLCDSLEKTLADSSAGLSMGLSWLKAPSRERIESYYKGIVLIPERNFYVGRLDGVIASTVQLVKPSKTNQAQSFAASIREHFVAPWARGHGLAKMLIEAAETECKFLGLKVLKLEVRANQEAAISLYESYGFKRWGTLDKYEMVDGQYVAGHFYYKDI